MFACFEAGLRRRKGAVPEYRYGKVATFSTTVPEPDLMVTAQRPG